MPSLGVYIQYHDLIACLASTRYQNTIQSSLRLNLIQQRSSETEQRFNYTTPLTKNVNNSMIPRLEQDFPSLFIFPKRALKCIHSSTPFRLVSSSTSPERHRILLTAGPLAMCQPRNIVYDCRYTGFRVTPCIWLMHIEPQKKWTQCPVKKVEVRKVVDFPCPNCEPRGY